MDLQLSGQVAVVVGGARGMGRAIAEAFLAEGCSAVVLDRDLEGEGEALLGSVSLVADATDLAAMRGAEAEIRRRFGRCDHVVYAAAVGSGKFGMPFWNLEPADWEQVVRVNLLGAVNTAHAFAPNLAAARTGTLLFLASVAGQIGSPTDPPYSASKAGLINFAQCAAKDLASSGVRVNTLCPGMVKTALNRSVYDAWAARVPAAERLSYEAWSAEKIHRLVPLGRWQDADDIAAMAVFLASPRAKNVTGQTINVDGGYVMHW
ncbi:NAD(P)-dependent dehydrogenase, short-chain alcohol dehydrogenase family [Singulisphaera sp. GP187]|uniref:SDR family NAD(P)-dependent oxidoreductase n=1 Tax=Singulisphaera sp. GP187 TaxID=1882752 RepID=UPI00092CDA48|nr:SDR family oxidoreductase [Singulisphaera sp. GP187]SIN77599.1 NAD(P)-dependent dehydrogenase, short-chain alcohol dehydrogenase family [Singulisphaera sp. GP187]